MINTTCLSLYLVTTFQKNIAARIKELPLLIRKRITVDVGIIDNIILTEYIWKFSYVRKVSNLSTVDVSDV